MHDHPPHFGAYLEAAVAGYEGPRAAVIRHMPDLYRFYAALYADPALPREARGVVTRVLAYLVVQDDVLPDDRLGPMGFIDDVFVAAHGYRLLCSELDADRLGAAWGGAGDLDHVMQTAYREARAEVTRKLRDILELAGFR